MEHHIAFKLCGKCKVVKVVTEFHKRKASQDGRQNRCKACGAASDAVYAKTDERKATKARYAQSDAGRAAAVKGVKKYQAANPEKLAAQSAVARAIYHGELPKAREMDCEGTCGKAALDWHHHSYREEDRLNVTPYCRKCHRAWHRLNEVIHAD